MKSFKTYSEQADLLISRGLENDSIKPILEKRLQAVGYYRLSGYLYPFRRTKKIMGKVEKLDVFREGVMLKTVWSYYLFDRRLRFLIMDAIERVEISFRSCIAYEWAKAKGISNPQSRPGSFAKKYQNIKEGRLKFFQSTYERSLEDFAFHFREDKNIDKVEDLPVWVFIQFSTFGNLHNLYVDGLPLFVRQKIAHVFGFEEEGFFSSIMALLLDARNMCAHHSRIWNRKWKYDTTSPKKPKREKMNNIVKESSSPLWRTQEGNFIKDKTAFLLTVLHCFLKYAANTSKWDERLINLLEESPPSKSIETEMGFPEGWRNHPLWR
ncbi:MAG: Abi family protein [Akkermansia sp.]